MTDFSYLDCLDCNERTWCMPHEVGTYRQRCIGCFRSHMDALEASR